MSSAEHSKAVVLLLLIHCFFFVASIVLCVWEGVMVGPCFIFHYLVSSFAIISLGKKDSWLLYLSCLLMSFDSYCSVSLPHGAEGWSTV